MRGEYGTSASDVRAEYIWMNPEVGDAGSFGGDDGLGGYMPLAVAANDNAGVSQIIFVHANHMGVPIRYSNASGVAMAAPANANAPGFPGQSQTYADLYYNRYRDYDSSTGRYIQADPIGLAGGMEPYGYAMNNPLRYSDPTGEFVPLVILGGIALGAGIDLAIQAADNWMNDRDVFDKDCYNWTQVGISGALGAFSGSAGGAGLRTAVGLSAKFSNVSRRIRRAEDLVGSGKDLHHWLLPRRWESAFGGRAGRIVNGRWNLNPLNNRFHRRLHSNDYNPISRFGAGSPTWARQAAGAGGVSIGAGTAGDYYDD